MPAATAGAAATVPGLNCGATPDDYIGSLLRPPKRIKGKEVTIERLTQVRGQSQKVQLGG
jgi:hypothetical protein